MQHTTLRSRYKTLYRLVPGGLLPLVLLGLSSTGFAQEQKRSVIEEVIVTAAKREQSLQDVSTAVTAVGADRLNSAQIHDFEDLQQIVPGITMGNDFFMAKLFIRGVGANTSSTGTETGVAYHVDGAVVARAEAQMTSLFDVERIEVLRGPQGTLFGRNTTGGAINVITGKPTDEFEGYGRVTFGDYNQLYTEGAISGPISENVLARFAFKTQDRDGFGKNVATGHDIDNVNRSMARLHLQFLLSDNVDFLLTGEHYRQNDASSAYKFHKAGFPDIPEIPYIGEGGTAVNPRDIAYEIDPFTDVVSSSFTGTLNWVINDNFSVTNILNYRDFDAAYSLDTDMSAVVNSLATNGRGTTITRRLITSQQLSEELQLKFQNDWVEGIFGLYYFDEEQQPRQGVGLTPLYGEPSYVNVFNNAGFSLAEAYRICAITDDVAQVPGLTPAPKRLCINSELTAEAWAAFTQWRIDLGHLSAGLENVTLKLGGRYTSEDHTVTNEHIILARNGLGPVIYRTEEGTFNSSSDTDFSPEIGLEWRATDDFMLYYTYAEGFKGGSGQGSTGINADGRSTMVDPETIKNNELGFKSAWLDQRLVVNASSFFYEIEGLQINKSVAGGPAGFTAVFENAARTEAYGFELEVLAVPTDNLRLSASVSYLHSRYEDFETRDPLDPVNVASSPFFDPTAPDVQLKGNPTRNAPDWAANLHAEYDIPGLNLPYGGYLTFGGDLSYKDDIYFSEFNRLDQEGSKAYTMLDLNLGYTSGNGQFRADLWVKNVTDVMRASGSLFLAPSGGIGVTYLDPRTFGITLGYNF